jgi:ATP-dependent Clp protease adaptor protein ClpS
VTGARLITSAEAEAVPESSRLRAAHFRPPIVGLPAARLGIPQWETKSLKEVASVSVAPAELAQPETDEKAAVDQPWLTIVWNDPVNLMDYVTYVFQRVFGYAKPKAEKLMLDVHHKGKAVVAAGAREAMERNAETLHGYGLWGDSAGHPTG